MVNLSSWGRLSNYEHQVLTLRDVSQARSVILKSAPGLPYGMGRSYGDVCLNPNGIIWRTSRLDNFISFDRATGLLRCEAGVSLREVNNLTIRNGWMLPVTPGTQFVTVGGAVANDVHGKNHHRRGSFGDHVTDLKLYRTDGQLIECGPTTNPDWFSATVGGLGLTGLIVEVGIQLIKVSSAWIETETIAFNGLAEFFCLADESERDWEYTVAWIDCLSGEKGRGIFMRGNNSPVSKPEPAHKSALNFSINPPISLINKWSLLIFNKLYYLQQRKKEGIKPKYYRDFFYPLDQIINWNRIYGRKGFFQYQCVVPREFDKDAIKDMLKIIQSSGEGSFLAVLKTFGTMKAPGLLSFPRPGVTLALDFPNNGISTMKLFDKLDHIVSRAGGRLYAAKDSRMSRDMFEAGYPLLPEFKKFRDPGITSSLSRRLLGA